MKNIKKIVSILCIICIMVSMLAVPAFAAAKMLFTNMRICDIINVHISER